MINHSLLLVIMISFSAIAMEEPSLNKLATNEILTIFRPKNTENKKRIKQVVIVRGAEMIIEENGLVYPLSTMAHLIDQILADTPEPASCLILDEKIVQKRDDILTNAQKMEEKFATLRKRRNKLLVGKTVVFHRTTILATSRANRKPASAKAHQAKAD